ncbi:TetR family transcriptional regulator [Bordetella ansorpii]|uniref:TetR family transcriptional regulator n=1 Tax=Bordetella ansorpii TaxID=288768 RepID=A0A157SK98_9BORD|nr:TetR/AcrR family transcriptional regulator [Bordetella ansorpii]SAI70888.1 TetR family transcriptional regulator [Bordetella ansorpii]
MTHEAPAHQAGVGRKQGQVVAAARELFLAHGFDATTMNMIASRADVSKATLYAYYPAKAQVFLAVILDEKQRLHQAVADIGRDPTRSTREKLLQFGRTAICGYSTPEHIAFFRMVIAATLRFPEIGRAIESDMRAPLRNLVAEIVADGVRTGELSCPDPGAASRMLLAMMRGDMVMTMLFDHEAAEVLQADMARHVENSVDAFMRAWHPWPPGQSRSLDPRGSAPR